MPNRNSPEISGKNPEKLDKTKSHPLKEIIAQFKKDHTDPNKPQFDVYQITSTDDLQSVELMRDLPFEINILSITDSEQGSPETKMYCMTSWGEDVVETGQFFKE